MATKAQKYEIAMNLIERIWAAYMSESMIATSKDKVIKQVVGSANSVIIFVEIESTKMERDGVTFNSAGSATTMKDDDGSFISLLKLNSTLNKFEMTATIAHELRHIWQEMNGWQFSEQSELSFFQCVDLAEEIDARNFEKKVISDLGMDVSKLSSGGKFWYKGE